MKIYSSNVIIVIYCISKGHNWNLPAKTNNRSKTFRHIIFFPVDFDFTLRCYCTGFFDQLHPLVKFHTFKWSVWHFPPFLRLLKYRISIHFIPWQEQRAVVFWQKDNMNSQSDDEKQDNTRRFDKLLLLTCINKKRDIILEGNYV